MANFCSGLTAVVIGTARQKLIHEVTSYFNQVNIPFVIYEDVYSALAAMTTAPAEVNLLVVGCFETLAVEDMRLFSLVPKGRNVFFCCIIKKWFEFLQIRLLEAVKAGIFVVNSVEQIDDVIKQCRGVKTPVAARQKTEDRDFAARIASLADSFFLTQAEQEALLGAEYNEDTENIFTK